MKKIINVLQKKICQKNPPIWIMRQAGRYLPEYRETRSKIDNFLDLCYNPKLVCEVTLQPLRRFDFDAGIIFSDILVIPDALGIKVAFEKNHGPKLAEFSIENDLKKLDLKNINKHLQPVFEAINLTKSKIPNDKALIGFAGAPWTLASYIIEQGGSKNFEKVRQVALRNPQNFSQLIEILTESVIEFLTKQIEAGVDIVKIFDSWAGVLPPAELEKWVIAPAQKIVKNLQEKFPHIPVIYFPKNIGINYENFYETVKPDCLAIDQNLPYFWVNEVLQKKHQAVIQGNLDNFLLAFGTKEQITQEVNKILYNFNNHPFIFNLGHGILPSTPIENVELLLTLVKK